MEKRICFLEQIVNKLSQDIIELKNILIDDCDNESNDAEEELKIDDLNINEKEVKVEQLNNSKPIFKIIPRSESIIKPIQHQCK